MKLKRGNWNLISLENNFFSDKKAQVTIFIIIAIVLVALVAGFFLFRSSVTKSALPASVEPVYTSFLSCLEEDINVGVGVLGVQGGYIELPEFSPGSAHMPFSSQLNFLGNPVPYWYYVSGNGLEKEQVPSKREMERQLENFIQDEIMNCVFDSYYEQGFEIVSGEPKAQVLIMDNLVRVNLDMDLDIRKGEDKVLISNHKLDVKSNLGSLYSSALKVYNHQQETLFLEQYGLDVLSLYAPVDGVELTCSPMTWVASDVFEEVMEAVEFNTLFLRTTGDRKDYFYVNLPVKEEVRFVNSRNWANSFEVLPSQGNLLVANPIGNQQGLGILGFCYVPYHFVYNLKYPVLVQVYKDNEVFQFPIGVVIQGNNPRKPLDATATGFASEVCNYMNTDMEVRTYDSSSSPLNTEIYYECFAETCYIGRTTNGVIKSAFPQCVNGHIIAKAEGFKDNRYLFSTVNSGSANIILDRIYERDVELIVDGRAYNGNAMISFVSEDSAITIAYPEQRKIQLSEDYYNVEVYIYSESSLNMGESSSQQCIDVPEGVGGLFGITKKKCFDINIPAQVISNVLSGGGRREYYFTENELKNLRVIQISAESLPQPRTIEQLQSNYLLFETKELGISVR